MTEFLKITAKKSLGQHFLTSDVVPSWMCDAAEIATGDTVLEIGPGTGVLTKEILSRGAKVIALEADTRAIEVLRETFKDEISQGTLELHHVDVRSFDISDLSVSSGSFKIVANIPYYLSGFLFRMFLESTIQPITLVYLVQKEVAKRITSSLERGEKESLLSLSVKAYGTPKYVRTVTRGHFTPPPKVDSGIIAVRNISRNNFNTVSERLFFNILHLGFGQKRKQLLGNLAKQYDRETLATIFSTMGLSPLIRAEDVPLGDWIILTSLITTHC